jgi:hypothetical protein
VCQNRIVPLPVLARVADRPGLRHPDERAMTIIDLQTTIMNRATS